MLIFRSEISSVAQNTKLKNQIFWSKIMFLIQHFTSTSIPWFLHHSKRLYYCLVAQTRKPDISNVQWPRMWPLWLKSWPHLVFLGDCQSIQATITKCHRRGDINNRNLFFTMWEAGSPRQWHQQIWGLVRPTSWFVGGYLVSSPVRRDKRSLWGLFYKDTNPIHEAFIFMN